MPEYPPYDEFQERIDAALRDLEVVDADPGLLQEGVLSPGSLANILRTTLLAVSATIGECRERVPYAPMHPVRTSDGEVVWCCTHNPPHPPECA